MFEFYNKSDYNSTMENQTYLNQNSLPLLQKLSAILGKPITFVDLETTGLLHEGCFAIIEIGVVSVYPDRIEEKSALVDPKLPIPYHITQLTGIKDYMVKGKKTFEHYVKYFNNIAHNHIFAGFNSKSFDSTGIERMARQYKTYYAFENQIDVRNLFIKQRNLELKVKSRSGKLVDACTFHGVSIKGTAHRAQYDIAMTALLAEAIIKKYGILAVQDEIEKMNCNTTKRRFISHLAQESVQTRSSAA